MDVMNLSTEQKKAGIKINIRAFTSYGTLKK